MPLHPRQQAPRAIPTVLRTALLGVLSVLAGNGAVWAEDIVTIRTGRPGQQTNRRVFGVITDIRDGRLILQRNGREEGFEIEKVVRYETTHHPKFLEGRGQFEAKNYAGALALLREAVEQEARNWVRREILAMQVVCYSNLGQVDVACQTFRIIYQYDPTTCRLDAIPLAWRSERATPVLQRQSEQWLNDDNAAAQLMAASWLLSGPRRSDAIAKLQALTDHADTRIAKLALAQTWRTKLVTAGPTEAAIWGASIEKMPQKLRGGPYFLLGRLYAQQEKPENAALAFLRAPILFPHQRSLCEQSLLAAARELETMGRLDEARNIYRELISDYSGSVYEDEIKRRYAELQERRKKASR